MDSAQTNDLGALEDREDAASLHARIKELREQTAALKHEIERLQSLSDERARLLETDLFGAQEGVLEASASPAVQQIAWRARQVAKADTPVLLLGESGVGKEWLARAIHRLSNRADRPFVKVSCASISPAEIDGEIFGHERAAGGRRRPGRIQIADGGTLLLDQVGELPLEAQAKLLRVLTDGTYFPVGSDRVERASVRVLASTTADLEAAIGERTFREDLFYRLQVFPLRVPPLRDRLEDLPMLCQVILARSAQRTGRREARVTPEAIQKLSGYGWPGNLRELANVLERAMLLSQEVDLGPDALDLPRRGEVVSMPSSLPPPPEEPPITLDEAQRRHIARVLGMTRGRIYGEGGAAKILGLKPSTLQSRMERLGMRRSGTRAARETPAGDSLVHPTEGPMGEAMSGGNNGVDDTHPVPSSPPS